MQLLPATIVQPGGTASPPGRNVKTPPIDSISPRRVGIKMRCPRDPAGPAPPLPRTQMSKLGAITGHIVIINHRRCNCSTEELLYQFVKRKKFRYRSVQRAHIRPRGERLFFSSTDFSHLNNGVRSGSCKSPRTGFYLVRVSASS